MLPVIIASGTPTQLAFPTDRGGEGRFSVPAVFQVSIPIDGVEDSNGLIDQALGINRIIPELDLAVLIELG